MESYIKQFKLPTDGNSTTYEYKDKDREYWVNAREFLKIGILELHDFTPNSVAELYKHFLTGFVNMGGDMNKIANAMNNNYAHLLLANCIKLGFIDPRNSRILTSMGEGVLNDLKLYF